MNSDLVNVTNNIFTVDRFVVTKVDESPLNAKGSFADDILNFSFESSTPQDLKQRILMVENHRASNKLLTDFCNRELELEKLGKFGLLKKAELLSTITLDLFAWQYSALIKENGVVWSISLKLSELSNIESDHKEQVLQTIDYFNLCCRPDLYSLNRRSSNKNDVINLHRKLTTWATMVCSLAKNLGC